MMIAVGMTAPKAQRAKIDFGYLVGRRLIADISHKIMDDGETVIEKVVAPTPPKSPR